MRKKKVTNRYRLVGIHNRVSRVPMVEIVFLLTFKEDLNGS